MPNIVKYSILIIITFVFLALSSCSEDQRKGFEMKPSAIGKAGSVLVVAEPYIWDGIVGKAFKAHFEKPYQVLPQPEPVFSLKQLPAEKLKALHKEWRNIIFLGVLDDKSQTTKEINQFIGKEGLRKAQEDPNYSSILVKDIWADGQQIFMIFAQNQAELIAAIEKRKSTIAKKLSAKDHEQLWANNYQGGENKKINDKLRDDFGINMQVPANYELAVYDSLNQSMWIRKETGSTSNNLIIEMLDYTEANKLTKENIISKRDTLGRVYITSAADDAYMLTDKINLPLVYGEEKINDKFSIQARGLWKMHNDFMGGPFVTYMVLNPDKQKVVLLDGFVHAPGKEKRPLIQQVELIMGTLKF